MKTPVMLSVVIAMAAASAWAAEAPAPAGQTETCVPLMQIDHTQILDDQNVLFFMKNRKVYKNHLPNRCAGLKSADTFRYKTSQNQLCNVDVITVLNRAGSDYMPGPSCGLGVFEPYTPPTKDQPAKEEKPKEEKPAFDPDED